LNVHLLPADGRFKWSVAGFTDNPWSRVPTARLPVWQRGPADPLRGWTDCQKLPYIFHDKTYNVQINFFVDAQGDTVEKPVYLGDGNDQFDLYRNIFSPWSNVNSHNLAGEPTGIAFEITDISDGVITFNLHINTAEAASPSIPQHFKISSFKNHPQITWTASSEPDVLHYEIWKKKEEQWLLIKTTKENSFTDDTENTWISATSPKRYVKYKIRVCDTQDKLSSFTSALGIVIQ
jgi:hypothetical protein